MAWGLPNESRLRARLADLQRLRRVVRVLVRHGLHSVVDQLGFGDLALRNPANDGIVEKRLGRRLALALTDLGPTFVKLGQVLATRDDVLPPSVTDELSQLQQSVSPQDPAQILLAVEEALGPPLSRHFSQIERTPLAAASIAQVHRATTVAGDDVVIKVQRPGVRAQVEEDLALLEGLAELAEERIEEVRRYDPTGLVQAFARTLREELDFRHESDALRRMREGLADTAHVPDVYDALCTPTVLTMARIDGVPVTDAPPAQRTAVAHALIRSFTHQILVMGHFHADPHPGNLLLQPDGTLAMLDFGAMGEVTARMRSRLFEMAAAAATADGQALAQGLLHLVEAPGPADLDAYQRDVGGLLDRLLSASLRQVRFRDLSDEIWAIARTHRLRLRPRYFQLLRTSVTLDGVLRSLDPELDPVRAARLPILRATITGRAWTPAWRLTRTLLAARWAGDKQLRTGVWVGLGLSVVAVLALVVWMVMG